MTNKEKFQFIATSMADNEEIVEFCNAQIASLDKAAEKAAERRQAKREESDEVYQTVLNALTDEPISAADLAEKLGMKKGSVVAKLTSAVKAEAAVKGEAKVSYEDAEGKKKTKKVSVYSIA